MNDMNIVDQSLYFWQKIKLFSKAIINAICHANTETSKTYTGWTNVLYKIQRLPRKENVCKQDRGKDGFKIYMGLEQKNIAWMKNVLKSSREPGIWSPSFCSDHFCFQGQLAPFEAQYIYQMQDWSELRDYGSRQDDTDLFWNDIE